MAPRKEPSKSKARRAAQERNNFDQHNAARIGQVAAESDPESPLAPGLYVTATPIGNASDITLRALKVLQNADAIIAEDTRVTARLLAIHEIRRPLLSYNDNNASKMRPKILDRLRGGESLALVSDAGTPLISDPGHKLVLAALAESLAVYSIPGPSASLAALSTAGIATDRFMFVGFLPSKAGARRTALEGLRSVDATLVFFESPSRIGRTLADMAEILGARPAAVMRELTKLHEEARRGTLPELSNMFSGPPPRGEITLVVGPPPEPDPEGIVDASKVDRLLSHALPFMPVSAAAALIAEATGAKKKQIYERALALKADTSVTG
jgi:16S rRNA (cytidine1402-2'-O)-methyltransferase